VPAADAPGSWLASVRHRGIIRPGARILFPKNKQQIVVTGSEPSERRCVDEIGKQA
jgi:hypothetical protein